MQWAQVGFLVRLLVEEKLTRDTVLDATDSLVGFRKTHSQPETLLTQASTGTKVTVSSRKMRLAVTPGQFFKAVCKALTFSRSQPCL